MHRIVSGAIAIVAIISAAFVDVHGGDPLPYIALASGSAGYATGVQVAITRGKAGR